MVLSVTIDSKGDVSPLQMESFGEKVAILLCDGRLLVYNVKNLALLYQTVMPSCSAICLNSRYIFAVCRDGSVFKVDEQGANLFISLKQNLSCCTANESHLFIACSDIPHDGSLIHVVDLEDCKTTSIEHSHFGDISKVKWVDSKLYSAGVDGLVCEYDANLQVNQVFNAEASVFDFAIHQDDVFILTDIHTVVVASLVESKVIKCSRPKDDVFGVGCVIMRKGLRILYTDNEGTLSSYKLSSKRQMKAEPTSKPHPSFIQCAIMINPTELLTIDDGCRLHLNTYRQLFSKHFNTIDEIDD